MRSPSYSKAGRIELLTQMDKPPFAREGETALSPERSLGWPSVTAKEGVRGGTMGSPTQDSAQAAARTP